MTLSDWQSLPDEQVVMRVRAGETCLYELLMRRYNQRLFRIVRSVVRDDAEAEDVLQHAWVRAYEHLDQFAGRATFATWVTKIAFYEALARTRKKKRLVSIDARNGDSMSEGEYADVKTLDPEQRVIGAELKQAVESAVDQLPDTYRSVFVLREVEQLSTAETAECLSLSKEAVKTRLHRSRAMLRRGLVARMGPAIAATYGFLGQRCDRVVARVLERISGAQVSPAETVSGVLAR
jgi:RNA polymerase sigma-70 factor, ECF subfamily